MDQELAKYDKFRHDIEGGVKQTELLENVKGSLLPYYSNYDGRILN